MARAKSKNIARTAQVLVASYLEIMGVDYVAKDGMLLVDGKIVDLSRPEAICSADGDEARAELEKILAFTGEKVPLPPRQAKKVVRKCGEDPDGTIWRENQLRQLPNPPSHVFKEFEPICQSVASRFFYNNRRHCRRLGLGYEDLLQYTRVWLVLFWGKYRVLGREKSDNLKLGRTFLNQRFQELYSQMVVVVRPHRRCPDCKTETEEHLCSCGKSTVKSKTAGELQGGLRTRRQLTSPVMLHEDTITQTLKGHTGNFSVTAVEVISRPREVRLGTLRWPRILAALEGRDASYKMEVLQDLAAQEYSPEISAQAAAEIARLTAAAAG